MMRRFITGSIPTSNRGYSMALPLTSLPGHLLCKHTDKISFRDIICCASDHASRPPITSISVPGLFDKVIGELSPGV